MSWTFYCIFRNVSNEIALIVNIFRFFLELPCISNRCTRNAINGNEWTERYLSAAIFNLIHFLRDFPWIPIGIFLFIVDFISFNRNEELRGVWAVGLDTCVMKNSNISECSQRSSFRVFRHFQLSLHSYHITLEKKDKWIWIVLGFFMMHFTYIV